MQLVPTVTNILPASGDGSTVLRVVGSRLWHAEVDIAEVILGDVGVLIRPPEAGDPWAAPTPTAVEVPVADAATLLPTPPPPTAYPVAVQVDGARSRDSGIDFTLGP